MERQKVFAAVGAGHLTGKENVIKLLRDKGFSVKPVIFKFNGDFTAPGKEFHKDD